jgi:hypothetical protein
VVWLAADNKTEQIKEIDLTFSEMNSESEFAILASNPEIVALVLEEFHKRTDEAIKRIAWNLELPFESDDIARRIKLGKVAEQLCGLIRGESQAAELGEELDRLGPALFTQPGDTQASG